MVFLMPKKPFTPNFKTPQDKLCKEELNKIASNGMRGSLAQEFRNDAPDVTWEAEALAKSMGMYLEFNRATEAGEAKDWSYMIRFSIPGGGPINRKQWNVIDQLAEKYTKDSDGRPSIRLTNRQNIQFHWIKKPHILEIVRTVAESGFNSLNGCGDNTRNVMGCPLCHFSDIFNGNAWAKKAADYFQLPIEPFIEIFEIDPTFIRKPTESFDYGKQLLNRKFKIAFTALHRDPATGNIVPDNCVEALTNDMSIAPILIDGKVQKFQIYIGGGQGERNGKPSMAALGQPLCRVDEKNLLKVMDAVVKVHKEWGDRENRWWSRIKYLVKAKGTPWFREQVEQIVGFKLELPDVNHNYGPRHLHHGWIKQPNNGLWTFGAYIENGRLSDYSENGKLKSMVRDVMNKYDIEMMITPNQDILFINITDEIKKEFEVELAKYGFGKRNGKTYSTLRLNSGACVGRDTCRLTYTDSEKFEPYLIDELENMGWSNLNESIGITGCERQCFRPATKSIGLVGTGLNRYAFKLFASEDCRHQGRPLIPSSGEGQFLRSVPRERVAQVIDVLFKFHQANKQGAEDLGAYLRRIGPDAIIAYLKENPATTDLMTKPFPTDCVIE
jgi:sulfite reductase (NADPH) hemoprotein beta-component